jgi:hypothetical protein
MAFHTNPGRCRGAGMERAFGAETGLRITYSDVALVGVSRIVGVAYRQVESGFGAGEGASDGGGGWFNGDGARVGGGELQAIEENRSAFGGDTVAGQGGDEKRDGDLDGFDVFQGREVKLDRVLRGVIGQVLGCAGCRGASVVVGLDEGGAIFDQVFVAAVEAGVEVTEGGETERG